MALLSACGKFFVERLKEEGENKAGENWAEGASLCETFVLLEGFILAVGSMDPTCIWLFI